MSQKQHTLSDMFCGAIALAFLFLAFVMFGANNQNNQNLSPEQAAYKSTHQPTVHRVARPSRQSEVQVVPPVQVQPPQIIGSWHDEIFKTTLSIVQRGETLFADYPGDSGKFEYQPELIEKHSTAGRKLEDVGSDHGDFFLITPSGDLEIWDDEGFIRRLKPVGFSDIRQEKSQ